MTANSAENRTAVGLRPAAGSSLPVGSLSAVMGRHPLIAFFVLAYGLSWLALLLLHGLLGLPAALVILLQTLGPTLAALAVITVVQGPEARARLLSRVRLWRVGFRWYLVALLGIPLACLLAAFALPGAMRSFSGVSPVRPVIEYIVLLVVGALSGPLFEEPGWRGFALPRLQSQIGPLRGTLLLGGLWAGWHLPQFLIPEWAGQNGGSSLIIIGEFLLLVVLLAPVMTWIFNRTKGSLLLVMVTHSSLNAALSVLVVASSAMAVGLLAFGTLSLALVLGTRGRLGYERPDPVSEAQGRFAVPADAPRSS